MKSSRQKPTIPPDGELSYPTGCYELYFGIPEIGVAADPTEGIMMYLGESKNGVADVYGSEGELYFYVLTKSGPGWVYWYNFYRGVGSVLRHS